MKLPKVCDVCGEDFVFGGWCTDEYGQCVCHRCGAVYKVTGDKAPDIVLTDNEKEIAFEYYQEKRQPAVLKHNEGVTDEQIKMFENWRKKNIMNR